jgi:hypothetical protein
MIFMDALDKLIWDFVAGPDTRATAIEALETSLAQLKDMAAADEDDQGDDGPFVLRCG